MQQELKFGGKALNKLIKSYKFKTVLDVGCGAGLHADQLRAAKKIVTTNGYVDPHYPFQPDIIGDFNTIEFPEQYDCVWASHVLEHQVNVNVFLTKCFSVLKEGGVLAITVPPPKTNIVGGHVTLWNIGLLLYNLVLAGNDCSSAIGTTYGYNQSVIVKKKSIDIDSVGLVFDNGDIEKIAKYFPFRAVQNFNGNITGMGWK